MRSVVTIEFSARHSLDITVDVEPGAQSQAAARDWLESEWVRLGCEPLRPSGKVLMLDKILGVADALGHSALASDEDLARQFASQVALALERARVKIDLPGLEVGF